MTGQEVCQKAADAIRERGLAKFSLLEKDGSMCLVGALLFAATGDATGRSARPQAYVDARRLVIWRLPNLPPSDSPLGYIGVMTDFNNHPRTTAEDVIAVLETAARGDLDTSNLHE